METGRGTSASRHCFIPSATHLAWLMLIGTVLVISGMHGEEPPQPSAAQAFTAPGYPAPGRTGPHAPPTVWPQRSPSAQGSASPTGPTPARRGFAAPPAVRPLSPSKPVRLRIPAIRVDAPLVELDLDAAGTLQPPPPGNPALAGWYADGTAPGSVGTAITAGHVDTSAGPAVFHALGALTKGATVEILRADRLTAVFTVDAVEVHDKKAFPDSKVYGSSDRPELRVITCGGGYTKETGYLGNVVVYATLTAVKQHG
jgi:sortase (surface protein transpeptidase)